MFKTILLFYNRGGKTVTDGCLESLGSPETRGDEK